MGFLGLFTRHKPKIKVESTKKDGFSGWVKCTKCEEMIHANELQENQCLEKALKHTSPTLSHPVLPKWLLKMTVNREMQSIE